MRLLSLNRLDYMQLSSFSMMHVQTDKPINFTNQSNAVYC